MEDRHSTEGKKDDDGMDLQMLPEEAGFLPYQIVADEKMPEGGEDEGEDFGSDREIGGEDDEREREKRSDDGSKLGERKKG
ncbi:hypothetical protein NSK_005647 [Nannochloropsis salina CCMP1776]|uniref:Uncharacterized protein n=1 Tax=Nannochloropsis salina CCMP1776 TaxID=1027361 RepID=A0A4D9CUU5_9STRA|nr:hypothetical protein NSK_005647 [Nannochloropsis salina CCMP1776]|eukprot:TFJ83022.1 hypothetical protein NSK_005647 [Nannochloropsis salina CCMP1776]